MLRLEEILEILEILEIVIPLVDFYRYKVLFFQVNCYR